MANFMGQRMGTVNGHPFLATRVQTLHYPSVQIFQPSSHYRFLIAMDHGKFWSPYIRHQRLISTIPKSGTVVELEADPLLSHHTFKVHSVSVVDLTNQVIGRPINFSLPYEVLGHEITVFKWHILQSRSPSP